MTASATSDEMDREREGRPTYVMTKDDGVWRIVMGQNTILMDGVTDGPS